MEEKKLTKKGIIDITMEITRNEEHKTTLTMFYRHVECAMSASEYGVEEAADAVGGMLDGLVYALIPVYWERREGDTWECRVNGEVRLMAKFIADDNI